MDYIHEEKNTDMKLYGHLKDVLCAKLLAIYPASCFDDEIMGYKELSWLKQKQLALKE